MNSLWKFEAIGTWWSIETEKPLDDAKSVIEARIEEFDRAYSRFRDDSLVSKIATKAGGYDFPADAKKLIELYRRLYDATDGAVSPLVGSMLEQAGYDKEYSLQPGQVRDVPAWDDAMHWVGTQVEIREPVVLDFGAAGKGYLTDIIGELLEQHGCEQYVIDASGDIRLRGKEETIGLENPYDPQSVIGAMKIKDASLCGSATNRRAWGDWHHVVDPRSKQPVDDIVATWTLASTTLEADGLATALFFVDAHKLTDFDFEYVRLFANGRIEHSPGFVGELFA